MPCDTVKDVPEPVRRKQIDIALERLEKALAQGKVTLRIGENGAIVFDGWGKSSRDYVTDVCAYRHLTTKRSWELRKAVAKAETVAGRKVSAGAVASGVHSHDGGKSWNSGH